MAGVRRSPQHARAAVVPFPRRRREDPGLTRLAPSGRALLIGCGIVALALVLYVAARESSLLAITRIEVRGASPATAAQVHEALAPLQGTSLLALGSGDVQRRVLALPSVVSVGYDRAFPHTLRVRVHEERPVAVLRRGPDSFLVSARARVMRALPARALPALPRIWVPRSTDVSVGATLAGDPARAVAALAPLARLHFPVRVATAEAAEGQLTLQLRSGLELRLGDTGDLALKLTVAKELVATIRPATGSYLDVSVLERPVAGANTQLAG